jgi:hypothetical protein
MSNHDLRDDKECENCGYPVEVAYCSRCGQKNVETRQSFIHLAGHFAEDLTHYDSSFWKTIKYLLSRPAKLTKEYLAGKTQSYVPPVKLYIFISFVTFLLPYILPSFSEEEHIEKPKTKADKEYLAKAIKPSLTKKENVWFNGYDSRGIIKPISYNTVAEMDSIEALKPDSLRLGSFEHNLGKRIIKMYQHNTAEEISDKSVDAFLHNIPKALFIYLPIFAFWLWIFHGKKRWYYFDHAIFTLHYFSFLLLTSIFAIVLQYITEAFHNDMAGEVFGWIVLGILLWNVYYFYRAHRKMYQESLLVNFTKSTAMFVINFIAVAIVMIVLFYTSVYTIH